MAVFYTLPVLGRNKKPSIDYFCKFVALTTKKMVKTTLLKVKAVCRLSLDRLPMMYICRWHLFLIRTRQYIVVSRDLISVRVFLYIE